MTRVSRHIALAWGLVVWAAFGAETQAQAGAAKLMCEITENGEPASGTISVQRDGKEIASGTCGREISLPAGAYSAIVKLDGALDGPAQTKSVSVEVSARAVLKFDFATGTLEIRIASQGKRAAGMAIIKRNGVQIGTLGSGVAAHLSAGTYQVTARYRSQEKDLGAVAVNAAQHVALDAAFE
jgi:hypothetical protein